jgi:hypothetical protein
VVASRIIVQGQPNWRFVKLHTHGCKTENTEMLLGDPMRLFHQELAALHALQPNFRFHYVSAWEMADLVHRAERGEADTGLQHSMPAPALVAAPNLRLPRITFCPTSIQILPQIPWTDI